VTPRRRTTPASCALTCDIDSTLADTTHRQEMIDPAHRDETDWTAYAKACADDKPTPVNTLVGLLASLPALKIVLVTSRPEASRPETVAWLERHRVVYDDLIMDDGKDYGGPNLYKVAMIGRVHRETPVVLHLDDWWDVNQALWFTLGIPGVTVRVYSPDRVMTR
jgi:hypothetical protein